MTPVDATRTSPGSHPRARATPSTSSSASASPSTPVATLAFLDTTTTAWSVPSLACPRDSVTLGPANRDRVKTAAAAQGRRLDAFVVRKQGKAHGLQRRIEGPDVAGRRVVAVEDTSTTGGSVLTAVEALREAGADVVAVAVIVDRGTGAAEAVAGAGLEYRHALGLADLGLG